MAIRKFTVSGTTHESAGTATVYSPYLSGYIEAIQYIKPGSGGLSDGSTMTITAEATGENIWTQTGVNASVKVQTRAPTHSTAGVAATYDGSRAILDRVAVSRDRVKIAITSGGNSKTFSYVITVDDGR